MSLINADGAWLIFPANFNFFLCFGRLLPNCWKSRSFHPFFHWVSLPFSCSYSALGRSIRDNCWKSCNFHAFPTAGKPHFYDFVALKGTKRPSFFRALPRFPAEFEHVTTYKQMAHGLCSLQFSKFSFALGGFCQIPDKLQFPSFQWVSLPFSNFSFALGRSVGENSW